nr:acylneuraminate cytidylyltransferase family protein [Smithellaceae bacterium]
MIQGKTVLAIIPARGGSKGIPRKNITNLAGKPLIAWTIEEAKKSKYIDRLILSSEDNEIIQVAKEWGCEVPFIRPRELAEDDTLGIEPVLHALNTIKKKYDYVVLLQPTSPLRSVDD